MSSWFILALIGAVLWGLHYPLLEKALEFLSPLTIMFMVSSVMAISIGILHKELYSEIVTLSGESTKNKLFLLGVILTEFAAIYMVTKAISQGNATYVSLIEISYPVFVIIFGYLLFKVNHFNGPIIIGSIMIFAGTALIVLNEPEGKSEDNDNSKKEVSLKTIRNEV